MCGFAGLINSKITTQEHKLSINKMTSSLYHRGPDNNGYFSDDHLSLGFRRLSIIDLTQEGNQPLHSTCGQFVIVFNGEIYNYLELREELIKENVQFKTNSDTEVLIELYKKYGKKMLDRINGMYSFAVYDKIKKNIFMARDRLGVKPYFIYHKGSTVGFSSETKALENIDFIDTSLSNEAIKTYLRLGFVPTNESIFNYITKLKPAHYIEFHTPDTLKSDFQLEQVPYWKLRSRSTYLVKSFESWVDEVDMLLEDATRIRLRSDVPIASFLSGGIDSALVVAKAAKLLNGNLNTLTFEVQGWGDNEWPLAQLSAKHLGVNALSRKLELKNLDILEGLSSHFDEPFADTSMLPTYLISQEMKKYATVALSGDGGDETFAGYRPHLMASKMEWIKYFPVTIRQSLLKYAALAFSDDSKLRRNMLRLTLNDNEYFAWLQKNLFEDWIRWALKPDYHTSPKEIVKGLSKQFNDYAISQSLDAAQFADIKMILPDDMLVKVDRMSMKASLEVRSPFLDYRFAELAFHISPDIRLKDGQSKALLRALAKRYLPNEIVNQPKRGFSIPTYSLLYENPFGEQALKELIDWSQTDENCPITADKIRKLFKRAKTNKALVSAIYRLLCLNYWLKEKDYNY